MAGLDHKKISPSVHAPYFAIRLSSPGAGQDAPDEVAVLAQDEMRGDIASRPGRDESGCLRNWVCRAGRRAV